jgi:N-acetyltransferase
MPRSKARSRPVDVDAYVLLISYAFERLGVERVSLGADEEDEASRVAFAHVGAWFEGIRRAHRADSNGTLHNFAYYSITRIEWPAIKAVLLEDSDDKSS